MFVLNEVKDLFFAAEDPSKLRMREARTLNPSIKLRARF